MLCFLMHIGGGGGGGHLPKLCKVVEGVYMGHLPKVCEMVGAFTRGGG